MPVPGFRPPFLVISHIPESLSLRDHWFLLFCVATLDRLVQFRCALSAILGVPLAFPEKATGRLSLARGILNVAPLLT
jgi:hypothetical protein